MTDQTPLIINNEQNVQSSVIWLHGLGADGYDFEPVVKALDMPNTRFILPHAPLLPVSLNGGYMMPAWYDIYGLDRDSKQDETGIKKTQGYINQLIQTEHAKGIPYSRIVIAGFSQGGAIALYTGLRYPEKLAGIIALSTYLPIKATLAEEASSSNKKIPIFMAHGDSDTVISLPTAQASADVLINAGYLVDWRLYAMPHSVCMEEVDDIREFLTKILP